ncbi:hypothetical protein LTR17_025130 [Elasticomyces elasticus]|nr:hypothetical protein LTR17_025130 [Elasticomyces elasticus]
MASILPVIVSSSSKARKPQFSVNRKIEFFIFVLSRFDIIKTGGDSSEFWEEIEQNAPGLRGTGQEQKPAEDIVYAEWAAWYQDHLGLATMKHQSNTTYRDLLMQWHNKVRRRSHYAEAITHYDDKSSSLNRIWPIKLNLENKEYFLGRLEETWVPKGDKFDWDTLWDFIRENQQGVRATKYRDVDMEPLMFLEYQSYYRERHGQQKLRSGHGQESKYYRSMHHFHHLTVGQELYETWRAKCLLEWNTIEKDDLHPIDYEKENARQLEQAAAYAAANSTRPTLQLKDVPRSETLTILRSDAGVPGALQTREKVFDLNTASDVQDDEAAIAGILNPSAVEAHSDLNRDSEQPDREGSISPSANAPSEEYALPGLLEAVDSANGVDDKCPSTTTKDSPSQRCAEFSDFELNEDDRVLSSACSDQDSRENNGNYANDYSGSEHLDEDGSSGTGSICQGSIGKRRRLSTVSYRPSVDGETFEEEGFVALRYAKRPRRSTGQSPFAIVKTERLDSEEPEDVNEAGCIADLGAGEPGTETSEDGFDNGDTPDGARTERQVDEMLEQMSPDEARRRIEEEHGSLSPTHSTVKRRSQERSSVPAPSEEQEETRSQGSTHPSEASTRGSRLKHNAGKRVPTPDTNGRDQDSLLMPEQRAPQHSSDHPTHDGYTPSWSSFNASETDFKASVKTFSKPSSGKRPVRELCDDYGVPQIEQIMFHAGRFALGATDKIAINCARCLENQAMIYRSVPTIDTTSKGLSSESWRAIL